MKRSFQFFLLVILSLLLTRTTIFQNIIFTNFESGSIGKVMQYAENYFNLALRNDNDNPTLSDKWRSWWFVKVDDPQQDKIYIDISHLGWPYLSMPAYSYDNQTWHRVNEQDVSQSIECARGISGCILSFSQKLQNQTVYLASFIPYTFSQLQQYLHKISEHPAVFIETLGYSSSYHLPIQHIMITDPNSDMQKARVWIQARTHPGETPSNFMLEGLIDFLLSEDPMAIALREKLIFHIVPMHNPDGVVAGNYRSDPDSVNLEESWFFDEHNPAALTQDAPHENQLLNQVMRSLLSADIPVKMALNLHASHSEPDLGIFSFPHFGDNPKRYTQQQTDLWYKQLQFIDYLSHFYTGRVELPQKEGYSTFLARYHPETWWWYNTQNQVMALTLEATYGKAGYDHWVTDREHRALGAAVAQAIAAYFDNYKE